MINLGESTSDEGTEDEEQTEVDNVVSISKGTIENSLDRVSMREIEEVVVGDNKNDDKLTNEEKQPASKPFVENFIALNSAIAENEEPREIVATQVQEHPEGPAVLISCCRLLDRKAARPAAWSLLHT